MKKKAVLAVVLAVGATAFYMSNNQKNSNLENNQVAEAKNGSKQAPIVEQKVTTGAAAIKKPLIEAKDNDQVESTTEQKELIAKLLKKTSPEKLKQVFQASLKNIGKDEAISQKVKDYILNFPFSDEFEKEFSKMHPESLRKIIELQEHPINMKLTENQVQIQTKVMEALKSKKEYSNPEDKQQIIDDILGATQMVKAAQQSAGVIIENTLYHTIADKNPKLSRAEAMAMSKEKTLTVLKSQEGHIVTALNITYGTLSKDELSEFLDFIHRTDAQSALELGIGASDEVYKKFTLGLVKLMKK